MSSGPDLTSALEQFNLKRKKKRRPLLNVFLHKRLAPNAYKQSEEIFEVGNYTFLIWNHHDGSMGLESISFRLFFNFHKVIRHIPVAVFL